MPTTERIEYRTVDKSEWPRGEWNDEPDKAQYVDAATGLDCLIVRGPGGALCGYVGVAEGHPFFGREYGQCALPEPCGEPWCNHSPGWRLDVHGGVTFTDYCHEPTREAWEKWREALRARAGEAIKHPKGDIAEALRVDGPYLDDYEGWRKHREGRGICHLPFAGRPARVWWIGFDCAHSGDVSPKYDREYRYSDGWYKPLSYVETEITSLARQLAAVAP